MGIFFVYQLLLNLINMKNLFLIFSLCLFHFVQAQPKANNPIEVTDLLKIRNVGKPLISPNGRQVLFTVMEIVEDLDKKGDYLYSTQLYLGDLSNKQYRQITFGKYSVSSPSWSPDGKSILFLRDSGNKNQAFILSLEGGEPFAITRSQKGINSPVWSKNGKEIYYQERKSLTEWMQDTLSISIKKVPSWVIEKPMLSSNSLVNSSKANPNGNINEIRSYLLQNEKDKKAKVINRVNFQEETTTSGEISLNSLFKISTELNSKPIQLNNPFERWLEWEPFSNGILATIPSDTSIHPDRILDNQIVLFSSLTNQREILISKKDFNYSNLTISPNENLLAFVETNSNEVANGSLKILDLKTKKVSLVPLDRVITQIKWSSDQTKLYFTAQDRGGAPLFEFNLNSKKLIQLTSENSGILGFDFFGDDLCYVKTSIDNPSELYQNKMDGKSETLFTHENSKWLEGKFISKPVKKSFKNNKGQMVDYWVMQPRNFQVGKKYPLVVEIHGGPSAMWGTGELSMWHEFQYYASKGMGVVYANPRGSGGYGSVFLSANVKDWGAGPMSDVMKTTDLAIAEGWADTTQLAITGGSYAGYLVTWIVGHTNRYKVACSQRGVYELSTFFGEGNAWRLVPRYFGGYPWETSARSILDRESPMTYVQNIQTPLIIFHGESDLRTGVIGSEMLYKSLKILGRDVEYVRHPDASHEITRAGNNRQRIDQMLRTFEFFSRYLKL
jgi:dipeptidyl aminopeptidase/acylaminoacyl peptidase